MPAAMVRKGGSTKKSHGLFFAAYGSPYGSVPVGTLPRCWILLRKILLIRLFMRSFRWYNGASTCKGGIGLRKKLIALAAVALNAILAIIPQSHAQNSGGILNRQAAVTLVQEHSTDMWNIRENIRFVKRAYQDQLLQVKDLDTVKTTFHNPYTDEDQNYYYDDATQMQLRLTKEYYPEETKFQIEQLEKTLAVTGNALANAADNLYSGMYIAYQNKLLAQKSLELTKKVLAREEARYQSGLITAFDLEEYKLEVETNEKAIIKADRDFENIHRQFNGMAGLPMDFRYDMVGTPYVTTNRVTITEDQAVAEALKNRKEIWEINRKIELLLKKMTIYQHKDVHSRYENYREDYADFMEDLEDLKAQLSQQQRNIEKEIRKAYQELQTSYIDLEMSKLELAKLKNQLETVTNQYRSGLIPIVYVEQLENSINQLETAVNMNMITTLTKKDQFNRAISIGPGY